MIVILPSDKAVPFEEGELKAWGHPFHLGELCYCSQREDGAWTTVQESGARGVMSDEWVQNGTKVTSAMISFAPEEKFIYTLSGPPPLEGIEDGDIVTDVIFPDGYLDGNGFVKFTHKGIQRQLTAKAFKGYSRLRHG